MTVRVRARKAKGRYTVDIHNKRVDGRRFRKRSVISAPSAAAAKRWGERLEAHMLAEVLEDKKVAPQFAAYVPEYIATLHARGMKASGIDNCERDLNVHVVPFIGSRRIDTIDDGVVNGLRATWTKGGYTTPSGRPAKPTSNKSTHNLRLCNLGRVLNYAVATGVVERIPVCRRGGALRRTKVPNTRPEPFYKDGKLHAIITAVTTLNDPQLLAALLLGCDAGLRRGEIAPLRWVDIDFETATLTVRRSVWHRSARQHSEDVPKGGKAAELPMTDRLVAALKAVPVRGERVFHRNDGGEVFPSTINKWMLRVTRHAGFEPNQRVHIYRHTYCCRLAKSGVDIATIKELARHSSIVQTETYLHAMADDKRDGIAKLQRAQAKLDVEKGENVGAKEGDAKLVGAEKAGTKKEGDANE